MSWDVMVFSKDPESVADGQPPPLGEAGLVRVKISQALPGVDWSQPAWGLLDGEGWSIEFNHQDSGVSDGVMLHVRGNGDPLSAIVKLCRQTGWIAFDMQKGEVIDLNAPSNRSWMEFQAYRDKSAK